MSASALPRLTFPVVLIKPSHYDADGYVIQWWKAWVPSNSLSCLYALTADAAARSVLGPNVDIVIHAYDETTTVVPLKQLLTDLATPQVRGLVCLVGVQSNQFPRAMDIARQGF